MQSVSFSSSSSRNWSGISRGSSSSSVVAQESRDDIECYLSMFKGKEGEAGHAVDWGKLLDGHEVLESTEGLQDRVCEEEEQEGAEEGYYEEAVSVFLKPNTNHLPPKRPQEKHADARCSDGPNSRKTAHNHTESHTHNSSRRGLGLNVTTVSSHLNAGLEPGEEDVSTSTSASIERRSLHEKGQQFEGLVPRNTQNSDSRLLECTQSHKFDDSVGLGVRENGLAATTAQDSRLSIELSSTQGVSGEDESEPSLSGIFKNNIFSLDQLEPPVQPPVSRGSQLSPSNTSTNSATEGEEDNSWESRLPYKLRSLTELESPAVDRDALGGQEGADDNEETEMRVAAGTPRRPGTKESGRESCSSGENDGPCEADLMSDGGSEVLSYEDDFESSTLSKSDQELGTDISSASGVQEERGETTSDGEYGDHEHSTYERERERSSMTQQAAGGAEHTTASSDVSSTGGGEGIAARQEVCSEHDDKSGLHKSRVMHGRTSKQEGKKQASLLPRALRENMAAQVDCCGTLRPDVPTSLLTLPQRDHLHPSPLPPPIITTDTTASSLVSETLQDLLRAQLALTKHLIIRSRSLAEEMSASLTPNYHYTTLEETKRYISKNRPKVLTSEEAREIVSQEEHSFF